MAVTAKNLRPVPRTVTILGSTGSVGRNTIDLIERDPDAYQVVALTANGNAEELADQARRVNADLAVVGDQTRYAELKQLLAGTGTEVAAGADAIVAAAARPSDWVMAAIVGAAGLAPTLTAARRGVVVALANKECLVCAGTLMLGEVDRSGATLLPVDSEHSAIFQVFDRDERDSIERVILTASGGPFWDRERSEMKLVTPAQAVAHPNWSMGAKISVDSATMMNKGLELIEAHYLFEMPEDRLEVLVHPQSIVHSLVAYVDGSVLAQLGMPDMRTPIAYALGWPHRIAAPSPRLDLAKIGTLTFEAPDLERFPALGLARQALQNGGAAPTILNAANEIAVAGFLTEKIGFLDIADVTEETLQRTPDRSIATLDDVVAVDTEARRIAGDLVSASALSV
jgi:1-deoxy-D-xylulose-5-phosphate reductoisomerase